MTRSQIAYLEAHLRGCEVDDIGCGYSKLRPLAVEFDYLGIDKDFIDAPNTVQFCLSRAYPGLRHDLAFISWPINRRSIAWHLFLPKYAEVIYLGSNCGGICCGDPDLWRILSKRPVLEVIPDRAETLIHYGGGVRPIGADAPFEEACGIEAWLGGPPSQYSPVKFAQEL